MYRYIIHTHTHTHSGSGTTLFFSCLIFCPSPLICFSGWQLQQHNMFSQQKSSSGNVATSLGTASQASSSSPHLLPGMRTHISMRTHM